MSIHPLSGIDSAFLSLQGGPVPLQVGAVVVIAPQARDVTAPQARDVIAPQARDVIAPQARDVIAPQARDVIAPQARDVIAPQARDVTAPQARDVIAPQARDVIAPQARDVTAPEAEERAPQPLVLQVREMLARRAHLVPAMRRRLLPVPLGLAHPVWVDDPDFDLEHHVVRAALPGPGGQAELEELVADRMSRPFDPDRPLWEIVVVEGLAGGRRALVVRAHHAMVDGVAGTQLLAALLDLAPEARDVAAPEARDVAAPEARDVAAPEARPDPSDPPPWVPEPAPDLEELARYVLRSWGRWPATVLRGAGRTLASMADVTDRNRSRAAAGSPPPPPPFRAPRLSCNGTVSATRQFASAEIAMAQVGAVRQAFGGTVHDVVLAGVAGGLRRVLQERGEGLPEHFVAMVPVSLRTELDPSHPGNQVSGMLVRLPAQPADAVARSRDTSTAARESKAQAALLEDRVLPDLAEAAVPALVTWLARLSTRVRLFERAAPLANVTVSSLRGPEQPLWCAGAPVDTLVPIGPVADGVGVNVTALSRDGVLSIGVLACGRLLPRPSELARGVTAEIEELAARASADREPSRPAPSRPPAGVGEPTEPKR